MLQKNFHWLRYALCRGYTLGEQNLISSERVDARKNQKPNKGAGAALSAKRGETNKSKLRGSSREMLKSMRETELQE